MKTIFKVLGIIVVVLVILALLGGIGMSMRFGAARFAGGYYPTRGFEMPMGFGLFGGLLWLAFWVLVIGGVIYLVTRFVRNAENPVTVAPVASATPAAPTGTALLDILKARYAKGEITKEQFDQMKTDLGV